MNRALVSAVAALATIALSCGEPPAPRATPTPAPIDATAPAPAVDASIDAPADVADASTGWSPPSGLSLAAIAERVETLVVHRLGATTFVAACERDGMYGCTTARFGRVTPDAIVAAPEMLDGLPPLGSVNLSEDKRFPKSNPKHGPRVGGDDGGFGGQRVLAELTGAQPGTAWAVLTRWGGEPLVWVVSDAYRRTAARWEHVASSGALGTTFTRAQPWQGGSLLVVQGGRFAVIGAKPGAPASEPIATPGRAPCKTRVRPDSVAVTSDGAVIVIGQECAGDWLAIERFAPGSRSGVVQAFKRLRVPSTAEPRAIDVRSSTEIVLATYGALPIDGTESSDDEAVTVRLVFDGKKWSVTSQDKGSPEPPEIAALRAKFPKPPNDDAAHFYLDGIELLAPGDAIAWGTYHRPSHGGPLYVLRTRAGATPAKL